jgi:hypothetical protein
LPILAFVLILVVCLFLKFVALVCLNYHLMNPFIDLDYELQPYALMTRTYYVEFDPMNVSLECSHLSCFSINNIICSHVSYCINYNNNLFSHVLSSQQAWQGVLVHWYAGMLSCKIQSGTIFKWLLRRRTTRYTLLRAGLDWRISMILLQEVGLHYYT